MRYDRNYSKNNDFFKEFRETSPALILGLIIVTLGLFIINWIFLRNREFDKLDKNAPNPNRGAVIMMILPFGWFFILQVLKELIFGYENLFIGIFEIVGYFLILFLLLKYLLEFCLTFGRITNTHGIFWFLLFLVGVIGLIGIIFEFYPVATLTIFLLLVIPVMQSELNSHFSRFTIRKKNNVFYS